MHCGVYHGEKADQQAKRILILAESHHTSSRREADTIADVPASYSTADVIEHDYIRQDGDPADYRNYRIFSKIINSFGLPADTMEQRRYFFQKVYFGNYIPVLCGVGNNTAKKTIQRSGNRQEYNDQLFRFVNDHQIDVVCCFSRLVYDNLPGVEKGSLESVLQVECEKCGGKIVSTCDCWVLGKPHDCKQTTCPALNLFKQEFRRRQHERVSFPEKRTSLNDFAQGRGVF